MEQFDEKAVSQLEEQQRTIDEMKRTVASKVEQLLTLEAQIRTFKQKEQESKLTPVAKEQQQELEKLQKTSKQKQNEDELTRLKRETSKANKQITKLQEKLKLSKQTNETLQNDLIQQHLAMEKQRKKYESELKNLRGQARMSENEQVNEKDKENKALLATNSKLIGELREARSAKEKMETNLIRVFEEAKEVKKMINAELTEFQQAQSQMSILRRQNLVLWKYIKKLNKKMRRERQRAKQRKQKAKEQQMQDNGAEKIISEESEPEVSEIEDQEINRRLEMELEMLSEDPDLLEDLKKLKR